MKKRNKYPMTVEDVCVYCGIKGKRTIVSYNDNRNPWYCCAEHKCLRIKAVKEGRMEPLYPRKKPGRPAGRKNTPSKHRRRVDSVKGPTEYEKKL